MIDKTKPCLAASPRCSHPAHGRRAGTRSRTHLHLNPNNNKGEGKRKIEPEPSAVHLAAALMALLQARHLDLAWRSIIMLDPRNLINLVLVWRRECIERKYLHWEKKMNLFACHPMMFRPSRVPVVDKSFMPLHLCFDVVLTPSCCWLKKLIICVNLKLIF